MLKQVTKERMLDNNGKLDIYSFMRSPEIRQYMKNHISFDLSDTIFIILKSMNSFKVKLDALKILASGKRLSLHEKRHILYIINYAERILQEIYSPESPSIIVVSECCSDNEEGLNSYEASVKQSNYTSYYSSYEEFLNQYMKYPPEKGSSLPRYEIDLVYQGKDSDHNNPIYFSATWFDNHIEIYAIHVESSWGKAHGFMSSITEYFWCGQMKRYRLPYPSMSKVKIQTPFMKKPLSGILDSVLDSCGCWYHFFYPYDKRGLTGSFLDFSYHCLEPSHDLSVFDWISKADGDISTIEMYKIKMDHEKITPIANLQPVRNATIIGRINQIAILTECDCKGSRCVAQVELDDKTGNVTVPINIFNNDTEWIFTARKTNRYIKTDININSSEEGNITVNSTNNISVIKESDCWKYTLNDTFSMKGRKIFEKSL